MGNAGANFRRELPFQVDAPFGKRANLEKEVALPS